MKKNKLSRRAFLRTGAMTLVGAAAAACQPKTVVVKETVEVETEKIVEQTVIVEAPTKEEVEIEVWHTDEQEFDAIIPSFQLENPHVKVNFQYYPWGDFFEKLEISYAAGTPPDVHRQDDDEIPFFAQRGVLLPLEDVVTATIDKDKLSWATIESTMIAGHLWVAIPATRVGMFWYNKTMFEEAGVAPPPTTYPSDDWTWDKFAETTRALTDVDAMMYGVAGVNAPDFIVNMGRSNGGRIISEDCSTFMMNEPEMVWAIEQCADLMLKAPVGAADVETMDAFGGGFEMWTAGQVALEYGQTRGGPLNTAVDFEWEYCGVPSIPGKEAVTFAAIECHAVAAAT